MADLLSASAGVVLDAVTLGMIPVAFALGVATALAVVRR